jgi:hypothetical protein
MTTTNTPPRPKRHAPEILEAAAKKLAPDILKWAQDGNDDELTLEQVVNDLKEILYSPHRNGYQLAKDLEDRFHYDPDAELVEILDNAFYTISISHDEACKKWLEENPVEPPAIGSQVIHTKKPQAGVGTIVSNSPEGRSTVRFPALGHVDKGSGTYGSILPWEELQAAL